MKLTYLFVLLFLAGCACKPIIKTVDQKVETLVKVPCHVPEIPEPSWPMDKLTKYDDIHKQVQVTLAEIEQRRAYELQLKAAIETCNDNTEL